jgi:hypothetical protein
VTRKEVRERWRAVVRLKVRGEKGRVPEDAEIARRAGFKTPTLDHCYAKPEFREMLRAEAEQVREEIRLSAGARLLHALRNPGEKDDSAKLALAVWDKSRRNDDDNGGGCEGNGCNGLEARLERLSDGDLAALAALGQDRAEADAGGAADAGDDGRQAPGAA